MQILFADESGTPPPPGSKDKYFVLGGVIIPAPKWKEIKCEFDEIKKQNNIKGEIKWRFFAPYNRDEDNSMIHLSKEERNDVRSKMFSILTSRPSIKIISVITSVKAAYGMHSIKNADDLYHLTYKPLTERFQYYLQDLERDSGQNSYGIIVCDHRDQKNDSRLQSLHQRLLNGNNKNYSSYQNLIEGLFVAPSHWSIGIQLADMVSGAVFRKFVYDDGWYFDKIRQSFRTSRNGKIEGYGLIKQPKEKWE